MPRCIIFEGNDRIGKSTQVEMLKNHGFKLVRMPSSTNKVGFLRDEIKKNGKITYNMRQALHLASSIVDAYEEVDGCDLVFDRHYFSGLVYGPLTGVPKEEMELIKEINKAVWSPAFRRHRYEVSIIFLDREEPFYRNEEKDAYESKLAWEKVRDGYRELYATEDGELFDYPYGTAMVNVGDKHPETLHVEIDNLTKYGTEQPHVKTPNWVGVDISGFDERLDEGEDDFDNDWTDPLN